MWADKGARKGSATLGWAGRVGGPLAAIAVYLLLPNPAAEVTALTPAGRATAAIGVLMAVLWITEAMPLPATSLLPLALFPVAGVLPIRQAAAPYAHEFIFLFMGGFMLAQGMERWGLHRRIALLTVRAVGTEPIRLIGGFMLASALLSMWISNTATTVMMLPIALSVIRLVQDRLQEAREVPAAGTANFATCLMLGVAYGASIGGVATIIGTPPNVFLAGFLKTSYGIDVGFGRWMLVGLPLTAVFLPIAWLLLTRVVHPVRLREVPGGSALIRGELAKLGGMSAGERVVLTIFLATALAWIVRQPLTQWLRLTESFPDLGGIHDAGIAVMAALLLFAIPVDAKRGLFALDWESAKKLPWDVLLLFGGGLSLASAVRSTQLDGWIGDQVGGLAGLPVAVLTILVIALIVFMTELTSNTATAATFLPILGGVALGIGTDPILLVVPAAIASSCAFMLPVATPPNAIVFGSGRVTIQQMVKAGFVLNLVSVLLIYSLTYTAVAYFFSSTSTS